MKKVKYISAIVLLIALIATNTQCKKENKESLAATCDSTNVSFTNTIRPLLRDNCDRCHSNANANSSGGGYALQDYNDVITEVDSSAGMGGGRLLRDIDFSRNPMPKGGNMLPACDIAKVRNWIKEGYKNN